MIFKNRRLQLEAHNRKHVVKRISNEQNDWGSKNFLTIAPALPAVNEDKRQQNFKINNRHRATVTLRNERQGSEPYDVGILPQEFTFWQTTQSGKVQTTKNQKDRDKNDKICLDRRGLTNVPNFISEKNIKMLSLQHNLITRIDGFSTLGLNKLVFLDLYNNQVEVISGLESFENLRVLHFGKNRLKKISGVKSLTKLEILDLHGNQINQISSLSTLTELKVLNLAGNQIRSVADGDLEGLFSLKELNLKRNRLRKVADLTGPLNLEKLFLSNNEISSVEDVSGVCKMTFLKEVAIDGNPISMGNECVHLLVAHLPNLQVLSHIQVTETMRKSAILWQKNRENLVKTLAGETKSKTVESNRVKTITNAKNNWELLKNKTECLSSSSTSLIPSSQKDLQIMEECESAMNKPTQSDSVLSVASPITLSSRDSSVNSKMKESKQNFLAKQSPLEEAADELIELPESSGNSEYFKLPPILAALMGDKSTEKSFANSDSSDKSKMNSNFDQNTNEMTSSERSEDTPDRLTEESEMEDSENEESTNNVESKMAQSSSSVQKKKGNNKARCVTAKTKPKFQATGPGPGPGKIREQGGDYLIEICGRNLNIYGQGALRFIDRPWNPMKASEVTTVKFNYVSFGGICNVLTKLKQRFPNAENFIFRETNITSLSQLNALADVQGLTSLHIDDEGNPITEKNWRNYAIYRLAHWGLKIINGKEVTEEDLEEVAREYQSLSDLVLWSLPETLLQPLLGRLRIEGSRSNLQQSAKQWLKNADPALRSVVCKEALQWKRGTQDDLYWRHKGKNYLSSLINSTCSAVEKLRIFETRWPTILNQIIRETLLDYSHMDAYMKKCIQELQ